MEVTDTFKGVDLIQCLNKTEVCNIVQEAVHRKIEYFYSREKEMQEGKVVVSGSFTNSSGKNRSEGQRRKGKYIQLNA